MIYFGTIVSISLFQEDWEDISKKINIVKSMIVFDS